MKDCKVIGELSENLLSFLSEKKPEFVRRIKNKKIFMWSERLDHIEKHKNNFCDSETFDKYVEMIPEIINKPDVIGVRDKDSSIQFIKEMDDNVLVAVRLNTKEIYHFVRCILLLIVKKKHIYEKELHG